MKRKESDQQTPAGKRSQALLQSGECLHLLDFNTCKTIRQHFAGLNSEEEKHRFIWDAI